MLDAVPNARKRTVLPLIARRLKYFPVVALQGARQTGKSFLAKHFVAEAFSGSHFLSFDRVDVASRARTQPDSFLAHYDEAKPLILDEAQKVPEIFDAVKVQVDDRRIPGRYLLLGSTAFSKMTRIRESLTGRMARVRVFPLTLEESVGPHLKAKLSRKQFLNQLETGGMPAIFAIRDAAARAAQFEDWIGLTCSRDLLQFQGLEFDSTLAYRILQQCARLDDPTRAALAQVLDEDGRKIHRHLLALCELFVLQPLPPLTKGAGKERYFLLDAGVAHHLGASQLRCLETLLMHERLARNHYKEDRAKTFSFHRSSSRQKALWVEEAHDGKRFAIQVITRESIRITDAALMKAFLEKYKLSKGCVLAPISERFVLDGVPFLPWEEVANVDRGQLIT